jgi:hypothetical protein
MKPRAANYAEWATAILLTLTILFLLVVRAHHAGALWRDECAALQLARMPTALDISRNFPHEAFPLLFPATIRAYTDLFGTSDWALRYFGLAIGIAFLAALFFDSRLLSGGLPLLSLALVGLNSTFLTWGTSIRGYGLGSLLIVLAFGLIGKLLLEPTPIRIAAASLVCLASVQCLLHNTVLLLAIGLSATAVCLIRRNLKQAMVILGIGLVCLISLLPYVKPYSSGRAWNVVVKSTTNLPALWHQLNAALGAPSPIMAWTWQILFVALIGGSLWRLYLTRQEKPAPEWDLLLFGILVSITSVLGYYAFLRSLNYTTRAWYYLALISLLGVALDLLASNLSKIGWIRMARLIFAIVALVTLPWADWPKIVERQTNIDIVAHQLEKSAAPTDLVVVSPWQFGIPFSWYYRGGAPWITVPNINEHRVHRYDLLKAKMTSSSPIDDVTDAIGRTLRSGHNVWFVGGLRLLPAGKAPLILPPAPNSRFGWDNLAYMESWRQQLGTFIQAHASGGKGVGLPTAGPVNDLENVSLVVVNGWRD